MRGTKEVRETIAKIRAEMTQLCANGELKGLELLKLEEKLQRIEEAPTSVPVEKEWGQKNVVSGQFESNRQRH